MQTIADIFSIIKKEDKRQLESINLIASENYVSDNILAAVGSRLTNKYAEGYPSKRYYSGCKYVDQIENLAIESAKKLFGVEYANVQPFSGTHANLIVYESLLQRGDTVMGLYLDLGGHLTHGSKASFSGKHYNFVSYGLDENEIVDYDSMENLALIHHPKMIVCGGSSYSRDWDYKRIRDICDSVGAYMFADISHTAGLIVSKLLNDPVPYADVISSTLQKSLRGCRGGLVLIPRSKEIFDKVQKTNFPGFSGGPSMNCIAAKGICFLEAMEESFIIYSKQTIKNTQAMLTRFIELGYRIVSGGSDNHLFVVDLSDKNITGLEAQNILEKNKIYVNRNVIPGDKKSPFVSSGIRIGLPFMTTLGFDEKKSIETADKIHEILLGLMEEKLLEGKSV